MASVASNALAILSVYYSLAYLCGSFIWFLFLAHNLVDIHACILTSNMFA